MPKMTNKVVWVDPEGGAWWAYLAPRLPLCVCFYTDTNVTHRSQAGASEWHQSIDEWVGQIFLAVVQSLKISASAKLL